MNSKRAAASVSIAGLPSSGSNVSTAPDASCCATTSGWPAARMRAVNPPAGAELDPHPRWNSSGASIVTAWFVISGCESSFQLTSSSPTMSQRWIAHSLRECIANVAAVIRIPVNGITASGSRENTACIAEPIRMLAAKRCLRSAASSIARYGASRSSKPRVAGTGSPSPYASNSRAISSAPAAMCAVISCTVHPAHAVSAFGGSRSSASRNACVSFISPL